MRIITTVFLLALCLTISTAYSQQFSMAIQPQVQKSNPQFITTHNNLLESDFSMHSKRNRYRDAVKFRNGGIVLTAVGVATIIVGAIMVSNANGVTHYNSTTDQYGTETDGSFSGAMGALGIVGGAVGVLGGGTMWIVGDRAIARERDRRTTLYITPTSARLVCNF